MWRGPLRAAIEYQIARLLSMCPDAVKLRLSREAPLAIDGQRFDAMAQLLRHIARARGAPRLLEPTIEAGRLRYRRETHVFRGPVTRVGAVRDLQIDGACGPLRARHYSPGSPTGAPLVVYLHGGGFVIGDLDTHDEPCRIVCRHGGAHVLSVEYRLAPEHPFPAAVDDACAAFTWAQVNAAALGADPTRVAIGGDSAGANLAAVVSLLRTRSGATPPFAQLLIYPTTDMGTRRRSHDLFGDTFVLTMADCDAFYRCYVGDTGARRDDPRLSPLRAQDLSNLPPALVVVAGFDVLRDEGEEYARALGAAGTPVEIRRAPDLGHGFIHLTGICSAARRVMLDIARDWGNLLRR